MTRKPGAGRKVSPRAAKVTFFATPAAFRAWLAKHGATATELQVGYRKRDSGMPSITWPESVDEALCYGWIDGVRRRIDDTAYTIRFTPRRPSSIWSAINIARMAELERAGRVTVAGRAAFACRSEAKSRVYAYERARPAELAPEFAAVLAADAAAWAFYCAQAPSYRRRVEHWIMTAKADATRNGRVQKLLAANRAGKRL